MPQPVIDYDTFRRVAETASAYRYQDTWLVVEEDAGHLVIKVHHESPPKPYDECVVFCVARVPYPPSPKVVVAVIGTENSTVDLLHLEVPDAQLLPAGRYAADAVFWSQSAVEKFVIPYYASVYGDHADAIVHKLLDVLKPIPLEGSESDPAFAIAHLPASEYVTLDEALPHLFLIRQSGRVERVGKR